ncbi:hypothetical protein PV326_008057, partial [Microctonus aethiopoides]
TSKYSDSYASQGTPPSSPAAGSIFSRVMGAATANKQGSGNALGIAAVLLQGAQAGNGIGNMSISNSTSSSGSNNSQGSQSGPAPPPPSSSSSSSSSSLSTTVHFNSTASGGHRNQQNLSHTEEPQDMNRLMVNNCRSSTNVEAGKKDDASTKLTTHHNKDMCSKRCTIV